MRLLLFPLTVVLLVLAPTAASANAGSDGIQEALSHLVEGTVVWDSDRVVEGNVHVAEDATLIVRGARIAFNGSEVHVAGTLIVESTTEAQASLHAHEDRRWIARATGAVTLLGTEAHPVVMTGLGGAAVAHPTGPTAVTKGFLIVGGTLDARHAHFHDYASALVIGGDGRANMSHVQFKSNEGVGLVVTGAMLELRHATFSGPGATAMVTVATKGVVFEDVEFVGTGKALAVRDSTVEAHGLRVRDSAMCLSLSGGVLLDALITGFECTDFKHAGVDFAPAAGTSRGDPTIALQDFTISTGEASASVAVSTSQLPMIEFRDGVIGPAPNVGIRAEETRMTVENVTFQSVGRWNLFLITPPDGPPLDRIGEGDAAGDGWQVVAYTIHTRAIYPDGKPAAGASIKVYESGNETPIFDRRADLSGVFGKFGMEAIRIHADGAVEHLTYRLEATGQDQTGLVVMDYHPDGNLVVLTLRDRSTPAPSATAIFVALGVAFVAQTCIRARLR